MNIVISVDGTDITNDVVLEAATFTSMANGRAGSCNFRVRDSAHVYTLVVGKQVTLDIDGVRTWGGFISQIERGYFFDAYDCRCRVHAVPRYLEVHGTDYNVLFQKRFLEDFSEPRNVIMTSFPADTFDSVVIDYYVANHLDLSGDGISTSLVQHVSTPSTDELIFGQAGMNWDAFMRRMAFNTGAIWYLDPDKNLVYADVETEDAPFGISDDPGVGQIGCRDMEILFDGADLINDALVWGLDQATTSPVFSRVEDATSISDHGRWQHAEPTISAFKQATVDRTASTFVNGSPQSLRGHKDDAKAIKCAIFVPGFRVAQKVHVVSDVFGFDDTIPIRAIKVTFPTTEQARWDLTIATEYDTPWIGFDVVPFHFGIPNPIPLNITIPRIGPVIGPCSGFVPSVCSTVDTFNRTFVGGWGLSEIDGFPWNPSGPASKFSVTPSAAIVSGTTDYKHMTLALPEGSTTSPIEILTTIIIPSGGNNYVMSVALEGNGFDPSYDIDFTRNGTSLDLYAYGQNQGGGFFDASLNGQLTGFAGQPIKVRMRADGNLHIKTWFASASEPGPWTIEITLDGTVGGGHFMRYYFGNTTDATATISYLEFVSGYACGGAFVGGTPTTVYAVQNADINHIGDAQWSSLTTGVRVLYNGVNTAILYTAVTPISEWPANPLREWLVLSTGAVPTTYSLAFHNAAYATRLGVYQLGDVTTGTTAGNSAALALLNIDPLFTVAAGESFTLTSGTYHLSPQGGTPIVGTETYWLGDAANEFDIPGHDAWILTSDYLYGATWCNQVTPVTPPNGPTCLVPTAAANPPDTNYQYFNVGGSYQAGTSQLWVDGLFMRAANQYIELPDQGLIGIDNLIPITGDSTLWFCANFEVAVIA